MGFFEDDRIRHKNAAVNAAYTLYSDLRSKFWSDIDIANHAESLLEKNPNDKVTYELLKMAVSNTKKDQTHHNQD